MPDSKTMSLVLLPSPPQPYSPESLSAAYRPALETALQQTSSKLQPAQLIVAVSYLCGGSFVWDDAQELLAGLYSLLTVLCKALQIETGMDDGPGSVDARVVLLKKDSSSSSTSEASQSTVLPSLSAFVAAHAVGGWDKVFYPESKAGLQLRDLYRAQSPVDKGLVAIPAGAEPHDAPNCRANSTATALHKTVCLGGTFDYLHAGHKLLLTAGALLLRVPPAGTHADGEEKDSSKREPCEYVIGITGDELLVKKEYAALVQPWGTRARAVADFLATVLGGARDAADGLAVHESDGALRATFRDGCIAVQCVRIHDGYGPTIERADMTCLVVSGETRSGGAAVNTKRHEQGWAPLATFVVSVLNADGMAAATATESFDAKISSSAIRKRRAEQASK